MACSGREAAAVTCAAMARTYKRDANGRFASGGGSSSRGPAKVGRSGPRGGKVGTRAEQRRNAKAQAARTAQFQSKASGAGRSARDAYKAAAGAARAAGRKGPRNGIRSTGGLPRPVAGNSIKRTTGPRRGAIGAKQNAIRTYRPPTRRGRAEQAKRQLGRAERNVLNAASKLRDELKRSKPQREALMREVNQWQRRLSRRAARDIANSSKPGVDGRIARIALSATPGNMQRAGRDVIRGRAERAAAAAARGSKAAARAQGVYDRQLAPVLPGKATKGRNNLRPGPRNTAGGPKRKRKPRKR